MELRNKDGQCIGFERLDKLEKTVAELVELTRGLALACQDVLFFGTYIRPEGPGMFMPEYMFIFYRMALDLLGAINTKGLSALEDIRKKDRFEETSAMWKRGCEQEKQRDKEALNAYRG